MTAEELTPPEPRRFRLFSIGGTTVDVRPSFLILVGLFVLLALDQDRPRVPLEIALLWIPVLFSSVLVHELAHAAVIALFGHGPSEIELGGWGGQTVNRRRAASWQEILISFAGPLSSFALALACSGVLRLLPLESTNIILLAFLGQMREVNVVWGIFNLFPIFPLDGGQILLHGLAHVVKQATAFVATTWISIVLAAGLGLAALFLMKAYFVAIIAASLVMQNWGQWQAWRRFQASRADRSRTDDPGQGPEPHSF